MFCALVLAFALSFSSFEVPFNGVAMPTTDNVFEDL
jgi:hypothetical protein